MDDSAYVPAILEDFVLDMADMFALAHPTYPTLSRKLLVERLQRMFRADRDPHVSGTPHKPGEKRRLRKTPIKTSWPKGKHEDEDDEGKESSADTSDDASAESSSDDDHGEGGGPGGAGGAGVAGFSAPTCGGSSRGGSSRGGGSRGRGGSGSCSRKGTGGGAGKAHLNATLRSAGVGLPSCTEGGEDADAVMANVHNADDDCPVSSDRFNRNAEEEEDDDDLSNKDSDSDVVPPSPESDDGAEPNATVCYNPSPQWEPQSEPFPTSDDSSQVVEDSQPSAEPAIIDENHNAEDSQDVVADSQPSEDFAILDEENERSKVFHDHNYNCASGPCGDTPLKAGRNS